MQPPTPTRDLKRWTFRQWLGMVALVVGLHLCLVYFYSDWTRAVPRRPRFYSEQSLVLDPAAQADLARGLALSDPTLFARASEQNFSGAAWLKVPALRHTVPDWTAPNHWLERPLQAGERLLPESAPAPDTVHPCFPLLATAPVPASLTARPASQPGMAQSQVRLEDPAGRTLAAPGKLPSWPYDGLLSNSIVEILVDAEGLPLTARMAAVSGSKEADLWALRWTKGVRLQPAEPDPAPPPFALARLVFTWQTAELNASNRPPNRPAP